MNLSRNDLKNIMIKFYVATNGCVLSCANFDKNMERYVQNIYSKYKDKIEIIESEYGKWSCYYTYINFAEAGFEYVYERGFECENLIVRLWEKLKYGEISPDEYEKQIRELPEYIPSNVKRKAELLKLPDIKIEDYDLEYEEYVISRNNKLEEERRRIREYKDAEFKKKFEKSNKKGWFF